MNWLQKLQSRWKVNNLFHVVIILIVFGLTGSTVAYLTKPVFRYFFDEWTPAWAWVAYMILILAMYNLFLLFFGLIFGQFSFFWNFEKRFFKGIASILKGK